PTIGCDIWQPPVPPPASLPQVACIAKLPVAKLMFAAPPACPGEIQAHLSAFSSPWLSVQPPGGFWSVTVSEYSCPSTIVTPSRLLPGFTKPAPQLAPASGT